MMGTTSCPLCGRIITISGVRGVPFDCPGCGMALRPSFTGSGPMRWVIPVFVTVLFFEQHWLQGVMGWLGYLAACVCAVLLVVLLNFLISMLFGFKLDPANGFSLRDLATTGKPEVDQE